MRVILFGLCLVLVSCSGGVRRSNHFSSSKQSPSSVQKIQEAQKDVLQSESMHRYSFERHNQLRKTSVVEVYKLCHKGDFNQALKGFKALIDKNRKNSKYWNQLASCYYLKGQMNRALIYFQHARSLTKTKTSIDNNLAVIFLRKGMIGQAKDILERIVKKNPRFLTARFNLGHTYLKYGLVDKAISEFNILYRSNAFDPEVLSGLATSYFFKGNNKVALSLFKKLPESYLRRSDIGPYYSLLLKEVGQGNRAREIASIVENDDQYLSDFLGQVKRIVQSQ